MVKIQQKEHYFQPEHKTDIRSLLVLFVFF